MVNPAGGFSWTSLILIAVNVGVGVGIGIVGWLVRRLIGQLDGRIDRQDDQIRLAEDKAAAAGVEIAAEREARHATFGQLNDRLWGLNSELKENYAPRRENLRQFGTLCQKIDRHHADLTDRMEALPCRTPSCPGETANVA